MKMRKRNNKINVFLSDEEKEILKTNAKNLKVDQSTYIRNLILNNNDDDNQSQQEKDNSRKY